MRKLAGRRKVVQLEMRLIDADKINYREHTECMGHGDFETVRTVTDKEIAEIPTVDAVEVVRCKDCIHWHEPEGVCLKIYSDGNVSPYAWQDRKPDDFCSYGKKII